MTEDDITGVKSEEVGSTVNDGSVVNFVVLKGATGVNVGLGVGPDTGRQIDQQLISPQISNEYNVESNR